MKNNNILKAVAAATLLGAVSLGALAQNVAIVNGKPVPKTRLDVLAQQFAGSGQPLTAEVLTRMRDEVVLREVFMQEVAKQKVEPPENYQNQMDFARQNVMIPALFRHHVKENPVTDAEVKAQYDIERDQFSAANTGKEYRARHILVPTLEEANKILADLKKGANFEELAKKQSKDTGSGANGGDLDWANPTNFVPEFSTALLKLKKGETTAAAVKSEFGYHIIRVDDIRQMEFPKLEVVKPELIKKLQQQGLQKYQEELRAKAKVE